MPLAAAIFLLFTLLGPVIDMLGGATQPRRRRDPQRRAVRESSRSATPSGRCAGGIGCWVATTAAVQLAWILPSEPSSGRSADAPVAGNAAAPAQVRRRRRDRRDGRQLHLLSLVHERHRRALPACARRDRAGAPDSPGAGAGVSVIAGGYEFVGFSAPSGDVGGDLVDVVTHGTDLGRRGRGGGEAGSATSPTCRATACRRAWSWGCSKARCGCGCCRAVRSRRCSEDLNAVLFPLKSGAMYVTAACVRGGAGGSLEYAVAGHLPILRLRAAGAVDEITTPQIPIGMFEGFRIQVGVARVRARRLLALITDGLTEVFDAAGSGAGYGRDQAAARPSGGSPACGDLPTALSPPHARTARRSTIRRCS